MREDLTTQCRTKHLPEDGVACKQNQAPSEIPGHPIGDAFKEPKPLSHNDDKQHGTKKEPEERQNGAGKGGERREGTVWSLLRRGVFHTVACCFYGFGEGREIHPSRIILDDCFLGSQQHLS